MKNNGLSVLRTCLFAAGLILSAFIGLWIPGIYPVFMIGRRVLTCTTVMLIYIAAAVPLFLMEWKNCRNYDPLFTGGAVYYRGFVIYAAVSIFRIYLIQIMAISVAVAVITQLAALFVFVVYVFLACVSGHHTEQVQRREHLKTAGLDQLREKFQMLYTQAEILGEDQEQIKVLVKKLGEDVRYLSPSDRKTAQSLEKEMLALVDGIAADPVFRGNPDCSTEEIMKKLNELDLLCRQRKNIN